MVGRVKVKYKGIIGIKVEYVRLWEVLEKLNYDAGSGLKIVCIMEEECCFNGSDLIVYTFFFINIIL